MSQVSTSSALNAEIQEEELPPVPDGFSVRDAETAA